MQTQTDLWKLQIITDRVMGARGPWALNVMCKCAGVSTSEVSVNGVVCRCCIICATLQAT